MNAEQGWLQLEEPRRPRRRASASQRDGLASVGRRALSQNERVLAVLRSRGRLTRHEISEATGLPLASVCRVVSVLIRVAKVREPQKEGVVLRRVGTNRSLVEAVGGGSA